MASNSANQICTKKPFNSEADALQFLQDNVNKGWTDQHPYKCENCESWHLTSAAVGSHQNGKYQPMISEVYQSVPPLAGSKSEEVAKRLADVCSAINAGKSIESIAAESGRSEQQVRNDVGGLRRDGKLPHVGVCRGRGKNKPPTLNIASTLESIQSARQQLEQQLRELEAKETQLKESRRVKVLTLQDGRILIHQGNERACIDSDQLSSLIEQLMALA